MRILVVEDEKRLAGTLADLLHRQGYTVDVSNDGVSGLDNALSGIYDLVVLDVMLPGMDGFELLRRLRGEGKTTPVLMLTARSGVADRVQGLDCGADYYLTKPFESEELLACVRLLLRRAGGGNARGRHAALRGSRARAGDIPALVWRAHRPPEPPRIRPHGEFHAQRTADPHKGAAARQGLGL